MARTSSHLRTRDRLFFFRAARFDSLAQLNSKWRAESLIRIGLELGFELGRAKGDAGGIRAKFTCLVSFHLDSTRLDSTRGSSFRISHFAIPISRSLYAVSDREPPSEIPTRARFQPFSSRFGSRLASRLGSGLESSSRDSSRLGSLPIATRRLLPSA